MPRTSSRVNVPLAAVWMLNGGWWVHRYFADHQGVVSLIMGCTFLALGPIYLYLAYRGSRKNAKSLEEQ